MSCNECISTIPNQCICSTCINQTGGVGSSNNCGCDVVTRVFYLDTNTKCSVYKEDWIKVIKYGSFRKSQFKDSVSEKT